MSEDAEEPSQVIYEDDNIIETRAHRILSSERITEELQDYAIVQANFGQMVTSEVSNLIEGGDRVSKAPPPVLCIFLSCGLFSAILAIMIGGVFLFCYALNHFGADFSCQTRLGVWLLITGALMTLWTLVWCASIFLMSSWFYTGMLHILTTFSGVWFLVGNVWVFALGQVNGKYSCSPELVYPARVIILTVWIALAVLIVPTALVWGINYIRSACYTRSRAYNGSLGDA
jgi:hypothetical protein